MRPGKDREHCINQQIKNIAKDRAAPPGRFGRGRNGITYSEVVLFAKDYSRRVRFFNSREDICFRFKISRYTVNRCMDEQDDKWVIKYLDDVEDVVELINSNGKRGWLGVWERN